MIERHIVPKDEAGFHILTDSLWCACCPDAYQESGFMVIEHRPLEKRRFGVMA